MKKLIFSAITLALLSASCSTDNEDNNTPSVATGEITGDITTVKTYPLGNYTIKGTVRVKSGASLRIAAGSTITADVTNGADALVIENGAQLFLEGTAALPIVFTEISKVPGSWGGIILYGNAPIVGANSVTSATSEDGNQLTYGGTNDMHNGGILKYVRVEYAGKN